MKIIKLKARDEKLEIWCEPSTRMNFMRVARHIKNKFGGRVLSKAEGPGGIVWRLHIEGKEIIVDLSDWPDFPVSITTTEKSAENLMDRIQHSLEQLPAKRGFRL